MIILGVHFHTHDTSVVLLKNGKVLYAASNERFSRIKMDKKPPLLVLRDCLNYTGISPKEIDVIAVSSSSPLETLKQFYQESSRMFWHTRGKYLWWIKSWKDRFVEILTIAGVPSFIKRFLIPWIQITNELKGFKGRVEWVQHHFCHVAVAYYTSGFKNSLVGVIEGGGYDQSMSFWQVKSGRMTLVSETKMPNSPGKFYELVTALLGFDPLKHAGKITGLAAYGNANKAYSLVEKLLWVEKGKLRFDYLKRFKWLARYRCSKKLPLLFQKYSKEDLAAAFQKRLEDCVLEIVRLVAQKTNLKKIALAGGVVANVKLNQKIQELPEIDTIHIHQAMGDDGLAMGATLFVANKYGEKIGKFNDVYFGPDFTNKDIRRIISKFPVSYIKERQIEKKVAILLSQGKVVARFGGRMEYGPRALGNRTIMYQTTDRTVNKWLNERLVRTEFMPFAPVTLARYADKCYFNLKGAEYAAKFMTITFNCTPFMKKVSPAVVHVDGTARPQLIRRHDNPEYYKILSEYYKITGIPSLINTSFNMHGEPIVCTPEDAMRSFLAGSLDYLLIGQYLLRKN